MLVEKGQTASLRIVQIYAVVLKVERRSARMLEARHAEQRKWNGKCMEMGLQKIFSGVRCYSRCIALLMTLLQRLQEGLEIRIQLQYRVLEAKTLRRNPKRWRKEMIRRQPS